LFDFYTNFQQHNAPAHRACEVVEFLARETPDLIPPELLSADRMNNFSSVNQISVKAGQCRSITASTGWDEKACDDTFYDVTVTW